MSKPKFFQTEAADWLVHIAKGNRPFAANAMDRNRAEKLFDELYEAGAKKIHIGETFEGGTYASEIFIECRLQNPSVFMAIVSVLVTAQADEVSVVQKTIGACNVLRAWWD